ncbi:MAG: tetratricopeptide repeat protein [Elusimicrobia bacterium]|nr:tetratricopeptide repeat protein [Elusimicrobiota bacterium]
MAHPGRTGRGSGAFLPLLASGLAALLAGLAAERAGLAAAGFAAGHDYKVFCASTGDNFVGRGEALIHGVPFGGVSASMPLTVVANAALCNHAPAPAAWAVRLGAVALTLLLVFSLGSQLHSPLCGALAVFLAVRAYTWGFDLDDRWLYTPLVLVVANLAAWRARSPTPGRSAALGLAVGVSLLAYSPLFLFPPLLGAWGFLGRPRGQALRHLAVLVAVPLLLLLPWAAMNWRLHRQVVLLEHGRTALNVVTGALGIVPVLPGGHLDLAGIAPGRSPLAWAAGEVGRHPARYAAACARRLVYAVRGQPLLFLLAFAALLMFRRREDHVQVALLAGYFVGIHCLMSVSQTHFQSIWFVLAALAASPVASLLARPAPSAAKRTPVLAWAALAAAAAACVVVLALVIAYPDRAGSRADPLDAACSEWPADPWLRAERGERLLRQGRLGGAVSDLSLALRLDAGQEQALRLAWALLVQGGRAGDLVEHLKWDDPLVVGRAYGLMTLSRLVRGREKEAGEAFGLCVSALAKVMTPAEPLETPYEREVVARLSSAEKSAVAVLRGLLSPWPAAERLAMVERLAKLPGVPGELAGEEADSFLESGDHRQAMALLAALAKKSPSDAGLRRRLAGVHRAAGEPRQALAVLEGLLKEGPADPSLLMESADAAAAAGDRPKALGLWERALASGPDASARRRIAAAFMESGEPARALAVLEGLRRREPRDPDLLTASAEALAAMGDLAAASRLLRRVPERKADAETRRRLAKLYMTVGDPAESLRVLEELRWERPGDIGLMVETAEAALPLDRAKATALFRDAQRSGADEALQRRIAMGCIAVGRAWAASEILRGLLEKKPRDAGLLIDLAQAALAEGLRADAAMALTRASAAGPDRTQRRMMAGLYLQLDQPRKALPILRGLLEGKPDDAGLLVESAYAASRAGLREEAAKALARARAVGVDAPGRRRMASVYMGIGEPGKAAGLLRPLLASVPADAGLLLEAARAEAGSSHKALAMDLLGRCLSAGPAPGQRGEAAILYHELGEPRRGLEIMDALVREHPGQARALSDRGALRAALGMEAQAREDLKAAIALDPGFLPSYLTLGSLYVAEGKAGLAAELYGSALARPAAGNDALRRVIEAERRKLKLEPGAARPASRAQPP